jgi:imidazole glycerol-phosphate synthase subunit HisH
VIALIDYRAGNLTSVKKALAAVGAEVFVPTDPGELSAAAAVIVPGVGHFQSTGALDRHWTEAIIGCVEQGRPLLGICLGMQWLFESSEEAPGVNGIGLLAGRCVRLAAEPPLKIPHVGWNAIAIGAHGGWITEGLEDQSQVYFTHSYVAPLTEATIAVTEHGAPFAAIVQRGHVAGVQFHPEKSGEVGLQVLRNFVGQAG